MKNLKELRQDEKYINVMSYISLSLFIIFGVGFLLFFIYGIASAIAFTALVPIVVFGVSIICGGISLACFSYFFEKKIKIEKPKDNVTKTEKVTTWSVVKEYITIANASLLLVIIGAVLMFTSIGYGSLKKPSWRIASDSFKAANGYYTSKDTTDYESYFTCSDVNSIDISLTHKNAVVIYSDHETWISFKGHILYEDEISSRADPNNIGNILLRDKGSPRKHEALDNMFWFIFKNNKYQAQIRIYIPIAYKDIIQIKGDYILAKN